MFNFWVKIIFVISCVCSLACCESKDKEPEQSMPITEEKKFPYDSIGALNGKFSVGAGKFVRFSRGLLQYNDKNKEWRFADNQYYRCAYEDNKNKINWFDTFGWATSGYDRRYPTLNGDHYYDGYYNGTKNINGTNYDWGKYNAISNGGNRAGVWRTLTMAEWNFVILKRTNAIEKFGYGSVNGTCGIILLPDDWQAPDSCKFKQYCQYTRQGFLEYVCSCNVFNNDEWEKMELAGAILLPTSWCGPRIWSSTAGADKSVAMVMQFDERLALGQRTLTVEKSIGRQYNNLVRLVTDK